MQRPKTTIGRYPAEKLKSFRDRSRRIFPALKRAIHQRPLFRLVSLILWMLAVAANIMAFSSYIDLSKVPYAVDPLGDVIGKSAVAPISILEQAPAGYLKIPSVPELPPDQAEPEMQSYYRIIDRAATLYQVDPDLILAMVMVESRYKPNAGSEKHAKGLMQLMPGTAKQLGVLDILNPEENILAGVKYFRQLLDKFEGDVELALAAYNAGFRKVRIYEGVPPYKETSEYIDNVFKYYAYYKIKKFLEKGRFI